jgi:membrane protease YdiL (CAAX protease family)
MKWIAPILAYLAVAIGIFLFHNAWVALIVFHVSIVASLLIARPNIPIETLFKHNNSKWTLASVLICGSSGPTLYFLWNYFGFAADLSTQVESLDLHRSNWIPFIIFFALMNPLIEEYFWRGYLGSTTKNLHVSDFLYSGFHGLILLNKLQTGSMFFGLAMLVIAGWFWRQIAREDGGLLAPVLGHMAADLSILMVVYLKV